MMNNEDDMGPPHPVQRVVASDISLSSRSMQVRRDYGLRGKVERKAGRGPCVLGFELENVKIPPT
jgi:hypothetical protein